MEDFVGYKQLNQKQWDLQETRIYIISHNRNVYSLKNRTEEIGIINPLSLFVALSVLI